MRVSTDAAFFDDFNFVLMHHRRVGGSFEAAVQGKFFVPVIWTLSAVLAAAPARAASETVAPPADDIADLSLEQLGNIVVTSVSRQEERLSNAAASIFIISASDIRRSGAQSIPEALRLAPNLQVAQVDGRNYAITARGFNSPFENKLLVMIDGRSVYSPLFSGVFWDAQDVVMEDIERIEVISGPGATIWGTNAVNGVINVITRSARDTQAACWPRPAATIKRTAARVTAANCPAAALTAPTPSSRRSTTPAPPPASTPVPACATRKRASAPTGTSIAAA